MTIINTKVNSRAEDFRANYDSMAEAVTDLREKTATIHQGGGAKYQDRHLSRRQVQLR